MQGWAVLTSSTGHELAARNEIMSLGHNAYCPIIKNLTKPKRKSKPVETIQAAFPGYLFADKDFIDFGSTPKLKLSRVRQLRLGEALCIATDEEIDRLRSEDDERSALKDAEIKFRPGDHVRVISGPLVDHEGMITASIGQRCELVFGGFATKIYMPCFSLEKIGRSTTLQ